MPAAEGLHPRRHRLAHHRRLILHDGVAIFVLRVSTRVAYCACNRLMSGFGLLHPYKAHASIVGDVESLARLWVRQGVAVWDGAKRLRLAQYVDAVRVKVHEEIPRED